MQFPALRLAACLLVAQAPLGPELAALKVTLAADQPAYAPGEPITFTLRIVNATAKPIRLTFRTAQRFDLSMEASQGREVWRSSAGGLFAQVLGPETLGAPGGDLVAPGAAGGA